MKESLIFIGYKTRRLARSVVHATNRLLEKSLADKREDGQHLNEVHGLPG